MLLMASASRRWTCSRFLDFLGMVVQAEGPAPMVRPKPRRRDLVSEDGCRYQGYRVRTPSIEAKDMAKKTCSLCAPRWLFTFPGPCFTLLCDYSDPDDSARSTRLKPAHQPRRHAERAPISIEARNPPHPKACKATLDLYETRHEQAQ